MNKKKVEECLSILLEKVIRTMINQSWSEKKQGPDIVPINPKGKETEHNE